MTDETDWHKSHHSNGGGNCLEAKLSGDEVEVRDSKIEAGPALRVPATAWSAFVAGLDSGLLWSNLSFSAGPPGTAREG
ncbi:DUF397 domain-containing protein [Streptomyces luteireticuli]|uniref:DUF397 domain-containing protein n=1 Tax=Streptomyces luteireticuli TaxID=173858 RepID=A0ABN0Z786_9ACTN